MNFQQICIYLFVYICTSEYSPTFMYTLQGVIWKKKSHLEKKGGGFSADVCVSMCVCVCMCVCVYVYWCKFTDNYAYTTGCHLERSGGEFSAAIAMFHSVRLRVQQCNIQV